MISLKFGPIRSDGHLLYEITQLEALAYMVNSPASQTIDHLEKTAFYQSVWETNYLRQYLAIALDSPRALRIQKLIEKLKQLFPNLLWTKIVAHEKLNGCYNIEFIPIPSKTEQSNQFSPYSLLSSTFQYNTTKEIDSEWFKQKIFEVIQSSFVIPSSNEKSEDEMQEPIDDPVQRLKSILETINPKEASVEGENESDSTSIDTKVLGTINEIKKKKRS